MASSNSSQGELSTTEMAEETTIDSSRGASSSMDLGDHGIMYSPIGPEFTQQQHDLLQHLPEWTNVPDQESSRPQVFEDIELIWTSLWT